MLARVAKNLQGAAPVQKYIVAVFDPAYGKALTVAVLEPDYCEELKRFVPVEEICSYVLVEKDRVCISVCKVSRSEFEC